MRRIVLPLALLTVLALPSAGSSTGRSAFVLGDSLALGTRPYLPAYLPGWRLRQVVDVGYHTAVGVRQVQSLGSRLAPNVVLSLGTNDDPRQVSRFRTGVRAVVAAAGPDRCIVWPNIVRPPAVGASYAAYNRVLADEAARHRSLRVVDWRRLTSAHPEWLREDGVHVTAAGYRARAAAIARALAACA
jgi:lysophospholipase L1-like esterase